MVQYPVIEGLKPNADVLTIHIARTLSRSQRLNSSKTVGWKPLSRLERKTREVGSASTRPAKNENGRRRGEGHHHIAYLVKQRYVRSFLQTASSNGAIRCYSRPDEERGSYAPIPDPSRRFARR
jgi:hypothetical protein